MLRTEQKIQILGQFCIINFVANIFTQAREPGGLKAERGFATAAELARARDVVNLDSGISTSSAAESTYILCTRLDCGSAFPVLYQY